MEIKRNVKAKYANTKPCPFCGKKAVHITIKWMQRGIGKWYVVKCGNNRCLMRPSTILLRPQGKSMKEAIRRWNKRVAVV